MREYWWSARKTCIRLVSDKYYAESLPKTTPESFRLLRPWVHKGWEMVLLASEFLRPNSHLTSQGVESFTTNYSLHCEEALRFWDWNPHHLQVALEEVRREALNLDSTNWLSKHEPFTDVVKRLRALDKEGIDLMVLTTKGAEFTHKLLNFIGLQPNLVCGHESGTKVEVLLELISERYILGFLEDRLATLNKVLSTPKLAAIPCYLASWGYLKPEDTRSLPKNIRLIKTKNLASPLASWH